VGKLKGSTRMRAAIFAVAMIALAGPACAQPATAFISTQPSGEWRANNFIGKPVYNASGEKIGDVNDLLFDKTGKIMTVVIGVGGFLGLGEKQVGMGYDSLTYSEKDGDRMIMVPLTKEALMAAPVFAYTEKTALDRMREKAGEMAQRAGEKAGELTEQAKKKIEEYRNQEQKPSQ
jgi:sporulation protein YlmC with PRC-barrel domain